VLLGVTVGIRDHTEIKFRMLIDSNLGTQRNGSHVFPYYIVEY